LGASVVPFADGTSVMPQWIVIENLEIRGAHNPNTFTGLSGAAETYTASASAICVELGENITVRNCDMNNNSNGFFVFSSNTVAGRNILVEGNCSRAERYASAKRRSSSASLVHLVIGPASFNRDDAFCSKVVDVRCVAARSHNPSTH
jgi:hypothetical protein